MVNDTKQLLYTKMESLSQNVCNINTQKIFKYMRENEIKELQIGEYLLTISGVRESVKLIKPRYKDVE